jgi:hypothetical protein
MDPVEDRLFADISNKHIAAAIAARRNTPVAANCHTKPSVDGKGCQSPRQGSECTSSTLGGLD